MFARPPPGRQWGNCAAWDTKEISRRRAIRRDYKTLKAALERRAVLERMFGIPGRPLVFKFHEFSKPLVRDSGKANAEVDVILPADDLGEGSVVIIDLTA